MLPAVSRRLVTAQALALSLRSDIERSVFSLCMALVFLGVKSSIILSYSLPPNSCRCWRPDRSWQSAAPTALMCSKLCSSARMIVYNSLRSSSLRRCLPLVLICTVLWPSGFKTTSNQIKIQLRCAVKCNVVNSMQCTPRTVFFFYKKSLGYLEISPLSYTEVCLNGMIKNIWHSFSITD